MILTRRNFLASASVAVGFTLLPAMAFAAAATSKRFVFIIQRGAADGLAVLPPLGDPALAGLRGQLLEAMSVRLDGFFGLHPALVETASLFASGEARGFHAVATSYRDRSHFDGQNVLESMGAAPYAERTGWMGRLLALLPSESQRALALAPAIPLALRGSTPVATYVPSRLPQASDDLLLRVGALYEADPLLAPLWQAALRTKQLAGDIGGNGGKNGADLGKLAASLMAPAKGARVMMIETGGWDTHLQQKTRLAAQLKGLDSLVGGMKVGLGPAWADTLVLVATEFGRTAAINGTGGTDHGTASAAFLFGGGLGAGKKVEADWPGLTAPSLYEGRDLAPTRSLGQVIALALARHYALSPGRIAELFR